MNELQQIGRGFIRLIKIYSPGLKMPITHLRPTPVKCRIQSGAHDRAIRNLLGKIIQVFSS